MYRLFAAGVIVLWAGAMAALFVRDVWPAWTAQDAPPMKQQNIAQLIEPRQQCRILRAGERIGTAWSSVDTLGEMTTLKGTVLLTGLAPLPAVRVETDTEFDAAGELDSFFLRVYGIPMTRIVVRGERRGIYFPCEMHLGPIHRQASLDMAATRMICDSLRPFSFLPTLHVGQAWRFQVLDPLSAALGGKTHFQSVVARVVAREVITHEGKEVECFRVETTPEQVTAWVDDHGRVLAQEVSMPGLGTIRIEEEPYDADARIRAQQQVRGWADEKSGRN